MSIRTYTHGHLAKSPRVGLLSVHDQIPWVWTLNFTATECNLHDSFSIEPDYTKRSDSYPPKPTERQSINMRLRPGTVRQDNEDYCRTSFSMFGTERII